MKTRKLLSILLVFALVLSSFSMAFATTETNTPQDEKQELIRDARMQQIFDQRVDRGNQTQQSHSMLEQLKNSKLELTASQMDLSSDPRLAGLKDTDSARFVIELHEAPVIETAIAAGKMFKELDQATIQTRTQEILNEQAMVKKAIENANIKIKTLYNFTATFNGFSFEGTLKDAKAIEALAGVKAVTLANRYDKPDSIQRDANGQLTPNMGTSKGMINAEETWDLGYNGEGTVVAVLDTGIDPNHQDMNLTNATEAKLTKQMVDAINVPGKYFTAKVPYGYNYADNNNEVLDLGPNPSHHGMHVSGTVGANGLIKGVAPETQILGMKVFGNDPDVPWTYGDIITKAIDDSVILGSDVINMSLGSTAAFVDARDPEQQAVTRAADSGVFLAISAGNSNHFAGIFAKNPDIGLTGAPSLTPEATTVASMENTMMTGEVLEHRDFGKALFTNSSPFEPAKVFNGPTAYVFCGLGGVPSDFPASVRGKIALISRGAYPFTDKIINAQAAGAAGVIIFNNAGDDLINMMYPDNGAIPAVFIGNTAGAALRDSNHKFVEFNGNTQVVKNPKAWMMSDFTSWGTTPDMGFKPEITAPGGQIWSTLQWNNYGSMSGTSMAAPHVAGAAALVTQRVDAEFPELEGMAKSQMVKNLLMSTAQPALDQWGAHFSPRRQGAGLMNVESAATTPAIAVDSETGISKINLKELVPGSVVEGTFEIKNLQGEHDLSFALSGNIYTNLALDWNGDLSATEWNSDLEPLMAFVNGRLVDLEVEFYDIETNEPIDVVSVPKGEVLEVGYSINLVNPYALYIDFVAWSYRAAPLRAVFPNGNFVEGFISLEPTSNDATLAGIFINEEAIPGFESDRYRYEVVVPWDHLFEDTVEVVTNDPTAKVEIDAPVGNDGGKAVIKVTAQDMATVRYYIVDIIVAAADTDSTLKSLKVNDKMIPGFKPSVTEYDVYLNYNEEMPAPVVDAEANSWLALNVEIEFDGERGDDGFKATITVTAQDNTETVYIINFFEEPAPFLFIDFEANNGGFALDPTSQNSSWAWGVPTSGPNAAYSGQKVWATNLSDNYNTNERSFIDKLNVNLSALAGYEIIVSWMQWLNVEKGWDAVAAFANNGSEEWPNVYQESDNLSSTGWHKIEVALDPSYATANFAFSFGMFADNLFEFPGWYIDDFTIRANYNPMAVQNQFATQSMNAVQVAAVEVAAKEGKVSVPLTIKSNGQVQGFEFDLSYDADLLSFEDITNKLGTNFVVRAEEVREGLVKVAMFTMNPNVSLAVGVVDVLEFNFDINEYANPEEMSMLEIRNILISDKDGLNIADAFDVLDGCVAIEIPFEETAPRVSLGIPYIGFYGDWNEAPIVDSSHYIEDDNNYIQFGSGLMYMDDFGGLYYLGTSFMEMDGQIYTYRSMENIAISPNGDGVNDNAVALLTLLRNASEIEMNILNEDMVRVRRLSYDQQIRKSQFGPFYAYDQWLWDGKINNRVVEGQFYYQIKAKIDDHTVGNKEWQEVIFPVFVDLTAPVIEAVSYERAENTLHVMAEDNHGVMLFELYEGNQFLMSAVPVEVDGKFVGEFDLSKIPGSGRRVHVVAYDYTWTESAPSDIVVVKDDKEPFIFMEHPMAREAYTQRNIEVVGAVVDSTIITEFEVKLNGEVLENVITGYENGQFLFHVELKDLEDGAHRISVRAVDELNNELEFERRFFVDATPAMVDIDQAPARIVNHDVTSINLKGIISDNFPALTVRVNGSLEYIEEGPGYVYLDEGNIEEIVYELDVDVALFKGDNLVTVEAVDYAGNVTVVEYNVYRKLDANDNTTEEDLDQNEPPVEVEVELTQVNNVGAQRPVVITAEANEVVAWEVTVKNPAGVAVRTFNQTGKTFFAQWEPNPYSVVNGEYTVVVKANDVEVVKTFNVYNYPVKNNAVTVNVQGRQGNVRASIENLGPQVQSPMLIVQVKDENGYVVYIGTAQMENLQAGQTINLSAGTTFDGGNYTAEVFVWDSWENKAPLSEKLTEGFLVQ